jgi:hypothetical protein
MDKRPDWETGKAALAGRRGTGVAGARRWAPRTPARRGAGEQPAPESGGGSRRRGNAKAGAEGAGQGGPGPGVGGGSSEVRTARLGRPAARRSKAIRGRSQGAQAQATHHPNF